MTANAEPTVSRDRLAAGYCPFCNEWRGAQIEMDTIGTEDEIYQDQRCKTCGREWRVFYGPVGVLHGKDYLPASDNPTWRATGTESEVSDAG